MCHRVSDRGLFSSLAYETDPVSRDAMQGSWKYGHSRSRHREGRHRLRSRGFLDDAGAEARTEAKAVKVRGIGRRGYRGNHDERLPREISETNFLPHREFMVWWNKCKKDLLSPWDCRDPHR